MKEGDAMYRVRIVDDWPVVEFGRIEQKCSGPYSEPTSFVHDDAVIGGDWTDALQPWQPTIAQAVRVAKAIEKRDSKERVAALDSFLAAVEGK